MAMILTDNQHYTDIASAIRSKAGVQDLFKPSEMASAIIAIPSGGGSAVLGSKSITENGTYYASADSLDGYSEVTVNVQGGGGGDFDALIGGTLSTVEGGATAVREYAFYNYPSTLKSVNLPYCTTIGGNAFYSCRGLSYVSLPLCTSIGIYAFLYCDNLISIYAPLCETIGANAFSSAYRLSFISFESCTQINANAFYRCSSLATVSLPACTIIANAAFGYCGALTDLSLPLCQIISSSAFSNCLSLSNVYLPACSRIYPYAFYSCKRLVSLDLTGVSSVPTLNSTTAFSDTPIGGYSATAGQYGSVYVPASLYSDFLVASVWSLLSARIVSV